MQLRKSRSEAGNQGAKRLWSRIFAASFIFFLAKGLIWLAVGGAAVVWVR